jgi:Ca2+-transporting ATPase
LLDDDFSSIVAAVRLGRRIFDNLRKAMTYILAIHVPIAGMSLIPVLFGWPLVLMPVHIVFLELVIDPACSIVFEAEPEEANVMDRPPRNPKEPLFHRRTVFLSMLQGLGVLAIVLVVFELTRLRGQEEGEVRAVTFAALVFGNLGLIFTNRSWSRTIVATLRSSNAALWCVAGGATVVLALVLSVPFLRDLFQFSPLHPMDIVISFGAGVASIAWFETFKALNKRRRFESTYNG